MIEDAITRRAVLIQRYADGNVTLIEERLSEVRDRILARMAAEPDYINGGRLTELVKDIDRILSVGFENASEDLFAELVEFAEDEVKFNKLLMDNATKAVFYAPGTASIIQTMTSQAMSVPIGPYELTIKQAVNKYAKAKSKEVAKAISDGILEGKTLPQIAKTIRELIDTRHTQQAKTLVRTATNATSNLARSAFLTSNKGLIKGYEWISTLDNRTTLICAGRDGNIYKMGKGPLPPAHWGCRSTIVPRVKEEFLIEQIIGERPQKGADGIGVTSAKTTYEQWLRRQPAAFQDEILGPSRGKLFRAGGVRVDQFRDETGRTYTLEQLRNLMPIAFENAGV